MAHLSSSSLWAEILAQASRAHAAGMSRVPDLEPRCGSWVAVSRATGLAVLETYSRHIAEAVNQERYEVVTALVWLQRINRQIKENAA